MNETNPSLYRQSGSKSALRTGIGFPRSGERSHGKLMGGRVTGKGTLNLDSGQTVELPESIELPTGSVVMGRLDASGGKTELRVLSNRSAITKLGANQLRPVLRRLGVPTTDRALTSARRQLRKRGYIDPARLQGAGEGANSLRRRVRRLIRQLDLKGGSRQIDNALEFLRSRPGADPGALWAELTGSSTPSGAPSSGRAAAMLREIQAQLTRVSARTLDSMEPAEIKDWLRQQGVRTDPSSLERARVWLDLEVPPTKERMDLLGSWAKALRNRDGSFDRGRVRALLFLSRNDLPVQSSLLRDLGAAMGMSRGETVSDLPGLDPANGNLAEQIKRFVQGAGFDLERRIAEHPDRAAQTIRALLAGRAGSGSSADSLVPGGSMLSGMNRFLRSLGAGEGSSRDGATGQFLKHALASVGEPDRIYLFVPFEEGGNPRLIQLRYEDEREPDTGTDPDRWNVTINLELSNLGPLHVEARRRGERIDLRFRAEDPVAVRRIRAAQSTLREALGALGFESTTVQASRIERVEEDLVFEDAPYLPDTEPFRLDLRA